MDQSLATSGKGVAASGGGSSKFLYIHVLHHCGDEPLETVRVPFTAGATSGAALALAARAARNEVARATLTTEGCRLFTDDAADAPPVDAITSYPSGGDLFARATADPSAVTASRSGRNVYFHFGALTKRLRGFVPGATRYEEIEKWLAAEGIVAAKGQVLVACRDPDDADTPRLPLRGPVQATDDGDVFILSVAPGAVSNGDVRAPATPATPSTASASSEMTGQAAAEMIQQAEECASRGKGAEAMVLLRRVIAGSQRTLAEIQALARVQLAKQLAAVHRYEEAIAQLRKVLKEDKSRADVHVMMGVLQHDWGQYGDATKSFDAAATLLQQREGASGGGGGGGGGRGGGKGGHRGTRRRGGLQQAHEEAPASPADEATHKTIMIRLGGSLFKLGQQINDPGLADRGIDIVQRTLNGDLTNSLGLLWMSRFYVVKGLPQDAISVACRLCAMGWEDPKAHPDMNEYKKNLADLIREIGEERGAALLREGLTSDPSVRFGAETWAFFATNCRDHGLLTAALRLQKCALEAAPHSPSHMLAYAHLLENIGDHLGAMEAMVQFLHSHKSNVGGVTSDAVLTSLGDVGRSELYPEFPARDPARLASLLNRPRQIVRLNDDKMTLHDPADPSELPPIGTSTDSPLAGEGSAAVEGLVASSYTDDELSTLAIYFTIVKNLFILGALHAIPSLLALLAPLRAGGKALHRTLIRNEHAYFMTVATLLQYHDARPPSCAAPISTGAPRLLYVCGDSHSLAPSWHTVHIGGEPTLLVNAIVTGLKLWHLRPESNFYPRRNFERVTASIPDGSDVMFLFGEIDCREGIVRAVERGQYESMEAALEVIADIYIAELLRLRKQKRFRRVFVHLPLPVIHITSQLVLHLCKILAAKLVVHRKHLITVYCHVVDDSLRLQPALMLDGTHISPSYVASHLAPALEEALRGAEGGR